MKVSVSNKEPEAFQSVQITIDLNNIDDLRALRRFSGGLPHNQINNAVSESYTHGPESDAELARGMFNQLYNITNELYAKRKGG